MSKSLTTYQERARLVAWWEAWLAEQKTEVSLVLADLVTSFDVQSLRTLKLIVDAGLRFDLCNEKKQAAIDIRAFIGGTVTSDCIDHGRTKSISSEGYAYQWVPHLKKLCRLHRVVYAEYSGVCVSDLPEGLVVRHKCDNPRCINPEHLEIGTPGDNNRDTSQRGRTSRTQMHHRKLSYEEAQEIRSLYVPRKVTMRTLASRFGISVQGICDILNNKTYTESGTLTSEMKRVDINPPLSPYAYKRNYPLQGEFWVVDHRNGHHEWTERIRKVEVWE